MTRDIRLYGTCNGSGALTVGGVANSDNIPAVWGIVYSVRLIDGTLADGVDISIYDSHEDGDILVFSKANFNTDGRVYPRALACLDTDGTALTEHVHPLMTGVPKMVIAQGGAGGIGGCVIEFLEE